MAVIQQGKNLSNLLTPKGNSLFSFRSVCCNFKIENYTNSTLIYETHECGYGEVYGLPCNIEAGEKMKFGSEKGYFTWYGIAATSMWRYHDKLILVYWHVPLSIYGGHNKIFVGITHSGITPAELSIKSVGDANSYHVEIAKQPTCNLFRHFSYIDQESKNRWLEIYDEDIKIRATIGNSKKCKAKVQIIPQSFARFAPILLR